LLQKRLQTAPAFSPHASGSGFNLGRAKNRVFIASTGAMLILKAAKIEPRTEFVD